MCRREDKAMITPSHLNTNSVFSVEYKISESHLGSISFFLTSASAQTWWSPRSSCPLSSSPWRPLPCPARDRSPGGYCWCEPRDISGWCHYHPSSVTILCSVYCIASIRGDILFRVLFTHLTVTKSDTLRSDARFSYFRCKTFKICHNFPLLVIPETKLEKYERILSNLPARRKDRITRNSVLSE